MGAGRVLLWQTLLSSGKLEDSGTAQLDRNLPGTFLFVYMISITGRPDTGNKNIVELSTSSSFPYSWEPQQPRLDA